MGIEPDVSPISVDAEIIDARDNKTGQMIKMVKLTYYALTGRFVMFLIPDDAVRMGRDIMDTGRRAKTGLSIAKAISGDGKIVE